MPMNPVAPLDMTNEVLNIIMKHISPTFVCHRDLCPISHITNLSSAISVVFIKQKKKHQNKPKTCIALYFFLTGLITYYHFHIYFYLILL